MDRRVIVAALFAAIFVAPLCFRDALRKRYVLRPVFGCDLLGVRQANKQTLAQLGIG
jgi:hypothetical protein